MADIIVVDEIAKATPMHQIRLAHNDRTYQAYRYNAGSGSALMPMFLVSSTGEYVKMIAVVGRPNTFGMIAQTLRTRGKLKGMVLPVILGYVVLVDGKLCNQPTLALP